MTESIDTDTPCLGCGGKGWWDPYTEAPCEDCNGTGVLVHRQTPPHGSWDTKIRCACGAEYTNNCQFWKHQADVYLKEHA